MYEVGGVKRVALWKLPQVCIPLRRLEEGAFDPQRRKASPDMRAVANEYMYMYPCTVGGTVSDFRKWSHALLPVREQSSDTAILLDRASASGSIR
jgi:hypothetical protein